MKRRVILCVDDDKASLDALEEQIFARFGKEYDCEVAESAEEALEVVRELETQGRELMVLITDHLMPGQHGDELIIQLHGGFPDVVKILLTGYAGFAAVQNVIMHARLYRYVTKPWEESDLLLTVEEAVRSYSQYAQITEYNLYTHLLRSLNKAAREISGEININRLIDKFLQIAIESTGAERGLLVLTNKDGKSKVEAVTLAGQDKAQRFHQYTEAQAEAMTAEVLENIEILVEMGAWEGFQLAAPIIHKDKLLGYIYLENTLDGKPFQRSHTEILEMLSSQAAISIENATLYADIQARTRELQAEKEEVERVKALLEETNQDMLDSIRYARRIQNAILPHLEDLRDRFQSHFVLALPKDVVSGDFYWWEAAGPYFLVAAVDCTGHGVPGAIMSAIGANALGEITSQTRVAPVSILEELHRRVRYMLHKDPQREVQDGMDVALMAFDARDYTAHFAGARRPLWVLRNGKLHEIPAGRFSIGGNLLNDALVQFPGYKARLQTGDRVFLCTDGYVDQFGGEKGRPRKFGAKKLRQTLENLANEPMDRQAEVLRALHEEWRGELPQTDDILVIGLEI